MRNSARSAPCKNCNIRRIGCHGVCKTYKTWKEDRDLLNAQKRRNDEYRTYIGVSIEREKKWQHAHVRN